MSGGEFGLSTFAARPSNQLALGSGWNHPDLGAVIAFGCYNSIIKSV
jgi:hypothetical protein